MDFGALRVAIARIISGVTATTTWGADGLKVRWRGQASASDYLVSHALCHLSSPRSIGRDSIVDEYDSTAPATEQITQRQTGPRLLTLEAQFRCQRAANGADAREYAARFRDRMLLESVRAVMVAAGASWGEVLMSRDLTATSDSREQSIAQVDAHINYVGSETDAPTTWIEYVEAVTAFVPPVVAWTGTMKVG